MRGLTNVRMGVVLVVLLLGVAGGAWLMRSAYQGKDLDPEATSERGAEAVIPAIDAAAPARTETATFALG